jgi:hypothetical protein
MMDMLSPTNCCINLNGAGDRTIMTQAKRLLHNRHAAHMTFEQKLKVAIATAVMSISAVLA